LLTLPRNVPHVAMLGLVFGGVLWALMVALNLATLHPCWFRLRRKKVSMFVPSVFLCLLRKSSNLYQSFIMAALASAAVRFL